MDLHVVDHPETRAERCLGRLCGLVTSLDFRQTDRGVGSHLTTELITTSLEQTLPYKTTGDIQINASGGGSTASRATLTALGEFLERYSMYWPPKKSLTGSYADLNAAGHNLVDLKYLQVWDDADLRNAGMRPFDADTVTEWTHGVNLLSGQNVLLPVNLVTFDGAHEDPIYFLSSTNGNACGSSLAGALVNSLYERVERDAVMRTWYEQRVPTRLDVSMCGELARVRSRFSSAGYQIKLLDLPTPTDCSVVASAVVNRHDRTPKFLLFAGAHRTLAGAVRSAVAEAAEGLLQTKYRLATDRVTASVDIDITQVYNLVDNVDYYMDPDNFGQVNHLLEGDRRKVTSSVETAPNSQDTELRAALNTLETAGEVTPIAVDLTPDDVRELGMYATGVYVPELVDISLPSVPPVNHPQMGAVQTDRGHPFP